MSGGPFDADLAAAVGKRLKAARRRAKLAADALAGKAGVNLVMIYELEAGRQVAEVATLLRLAGALRVDLDDLATRRRDRSDPPRLAKGEHPFDAFARANGESQAAFARRAGVAPQQLADWKAGRKAVSLPNLLALARAGDCPVGWLAERLAA